MYSLIINLLRFTNNILRKLGFEIKKYKKKNDEIRKLRKKLIKKSPIIFDVGANVGQSIDRFLADFKEPQIHSFEPNNEAFQILKEKYSKHKNIFLNNFALGETKKKKILNCTVKSGNSSFYNLNINSDWIKEKAEMFNVKIKDYVKKKQIAEIKTIDQYLKKNKIKRIDLLKIDTQGYEEKVLIGCKKNLNKIKNIELEIMLDDCYNAETSFYKIERILYPKKFRIFGLMNNKSTKFTGKNFGSYVFYSRIN